MKKDKIIKARVDEVEYKKIMENYKQSNYKTFSDFFRYSLIKKEINIINFDNILERNYEINKIGNNINQIAKQANTNQDFYYNDFLYFEKEFEKLLKENAEINKMILDKLKE